jgi:alkylhydroperoxidase/carboxymuconolactone decarboxylase family protein YurZ
VLSDEIGGGVIRQDVQEAIQRELNYRLGEGDAPGALSRWEKELLLIAVNAVKPNACLSQLHARAAIKAGATIDQVLEVTLSIILIGMIRWKMAGMWALEAAKQEASEELKRLEVTGQAQAGEAARIEEIRQYVRKVLHREFPDMWEVLKDVAPAILDGYMKIRENIVKPDPHGALPKKMVELTIVSYDILQANSWGAQMHVKEAIRDGATVPEVVEAVALVMIEGGVPIYKTGGLEVIEAAEEAAAELKG